MDLALPARERRRRPPEERGRRADVAVDALAMDLLKDSERGRANGLMYGSKYLGTIVDGAGLSWVVAVSGLQVALIVQVVLLGAIFLLPLLLRERSEDLLWGWHRAAVAGVPQPRFVVLMPTAVAVSRLAAGKRLFVGLFGDLYRAFTLRSTLLGPVWR